MTRARILVVEDEHIVAKDIAARLDRRGYEVVAIVATASEAIAMAETRYPDLVLMDVMLKGDMDGIAAADRIRERFDIPIVYLTAYADENTLQRAKITDAFGYILKPFEERELYITIEMALYKHRIEARLRQSEQWLSTTLHSIGDGIIAATTEGKVMLVNHVAETLTGWRQEDALGRSLSEVFTLEEHQPLAGSIPRVFLRSREGRRTEIEQQSNPMKDDRGNARGVVVVFRDVTEQRKAEEALRASEERYRRFFEEDLTGDYVATPEGKLLDCNPAFARILGYPTVHDALSCNLLTLYPSPQAWGEFWSLLLQQGKIEYFEKDLIRPDGALIHVVENTIVRRDESGNVVEYKGYMFDNTERRKLEEQLRQSHKMESIGTLASGIAHDFNNILNNVIGFVLQIRKHVADPEKVLRYSQTIEKSAKRGADLSSQLLSFARKGRRESVPVNVSHLIDEVVSLSRETFPRSITVEKSVESPHLFVLGDHGELYQVLLNLCVNSRDAIVARGGSGGTIHLVAREAKVGDSISPSMLPVHGIDFVEVHVSDDGTGIPSAIREKIFDPFFTTKERGHGTGLGLSVVYTVVRNHHGTILVEGEEGKGATFRIFLPAAAPSERKKDEGIEPLGVRAGQNELVMIVDDEESMQELGRELLEEEGYKVLVASNGSEALDVYRNRHQEINLVILDLVMPGMDGGQTYLELKKVNPSLKALFCTGFMPDQVISALLEEQKLLAVQKPFHPDAFLQTIRRVLDTSAEE